MMKRTRSLAGPGLALLLLIAWTSGGLHGQAPPPRPTVLPEPDEVKPEGELPPPPPQALPALPSIGATKVRAEKLPEPVVPPEAPAGGEEAGKMKEEAPAAGPELPPLSPTPTPAPAPAAPLAEEAAPPTPAPREAKVTGAVGKQVPAVSIEWVGPPVVRIGAPVPYRIVVRNVSSTSVTGVAVQARLPEGAVLKDSSPRAISGDGVHSWDVGDLHPRQEKRIALTIVPGATGEFACRASVNFTGSSVLQMKVQEPKLEVKLEAPGKVTVGDPATIKATVRNPGDATAEGVKLRAQLSEGLRHVRGKEVEFALGNLPPREGRTVLILCDTSADGVQTCGVVAQSTQGLSAKGKAAVEVLTPRLTLGVKAPRMRYLGRQAEIDIQVNNTGNAPAQGVSITDQVPPGFQMVQCNAGGSYDYATRTVSWYLGTIEPGQTREVSLHLLAKAVGEHKNHVKVTAARGLHVQGEATTHVEGLSALVMVLADRDDPVEVGTETAYEVRVTNTGTKTETNLRLSCAIPPEMELLGAHGAGGVSFKVTGRDIVFDPLPALAPRADATYHIQVRGAKPGDVRFQARIQADGLSASVLKEESTHVYGDEVAPRPAPKGDATKEGL
jgi:uncharacterized repeat protein (TIGR01451 family)